MRKILERVLSVLAKRSWNLIDIGGISACVGMVIEKRYGTALIIFLVVSAVSALIELFAEEYERRSNG